MNTWGDYYLAESLGEALKRKGHEYSIQVMTQWYTDQDRDANVVIHIRGLTAYIPKPNHFNIMWNISHPANVMIEEYNSYDLVLIASLLHHDKISALIEKPSDSFLQFTDANRFFPEYDNLHKSQILFVGNSRKVYRTIVKEAIDNSIPLSVVGENWSGIIDKKYIKSKWFSNNSLRLLYSSCNILLNDHWDDMKEYGFVNNRLFDALACRAIVINDNNPEILKIFPNAIIMDEYNPLVATINKINSSYESYCQNAITLQNEVLKHHTADIRAEQLLNLLESQFHIKKNHKMKGSTKVGISNKIRDMIIRKRGFGKLYKILNKPYKMVKKRMFQFAYYKSKVMPNKVTILKGEHRLICFLVSENGNQTTCGDFFSAKALGDELQKNYNYIPMYLSRNPYQWNDIPKNTDIVVSMLHDTDIGHVNVPKNSIKIAWMRSYVDQWIQSPQIYNYDGVITTSNYWDSIIRSNLPSDLCWGIVPLGLSNDFFLHKGRTTNDESRDIDVCFIGNISNYNRQVVRDLVLLDAFNFHFYGTLNTQFHHPWRKYHRGPIQHSDVYNIYSRSKLVIEDTTGMTYNTINLRTYEAAACGAFIIANDTPGLKELLDGNVDIYHDSDELMEKISFYLGHLETRKLLADRAQNIVRRNHTFRQRAELFHKIVSSKMK
ncbi:glycosyltransferase family protein [Paenibacillus dendrobii]|nr:glycosyltransferase [Paenibacillus dendrobii]